MKKKRGIQSLMLLGMFVFAFSMLILSGAKNVYAAVGGTYSVSGTKNYLALRSAPAYDTKNEIGRLQNGDTVVSLDESNGQYWYVSSSKLGMKGYVNKDYLSSSSSSYSGGKTYTVVGAKNYLALRNAPSYDAKNEIGRLQNGDTVTVSDASSNSQYWYVTSQRLGMSGYVNKDYLSASGGSSSGGVDYGESHPNRYYTVSGTKNYLALRSEPTYDDRNEIGKLFNGDHVFALSGDMDLYSYSDADDYLYVRVLSTGVCGYVNAKYLVRE